MVLFAQAPLAAPDELPQGLAGLVGRHDLRGSPCVLVLEPGGYQMLQIERPSVEPGELREAARWRVRELVDFPVDTAAIDVFELPAGSSSARSAYVVAARGEAIRSQVRQVQDAGLKLEVVDIPELAVGNLVELMPENATGVAVLCVGRQNSSVALYRQSALYLARTLGVGVERLAALEPRAEDLEGAHFSHELEGMVLEIQRSLDYFESHFGQAPINSLILMPTAEPLPALLEALERSLTVRVSLFDPAAVLDWAEQPTPQDLAACLGALGGALRLRAGAA